MRKVLVIASLGLALAGLLPAAQGASPKVRLVSCVNTAFDNEPGALNRCKNARSLRYDFMTITDGVVYTSAEGLGIEVWPVSADGRLSQGACYKSFPGGDACTKMTDSFTPTYLTPSPDGKHLYTVNAYNNGISIFDVGGGGALTYRDCVGMEGATDSCSEHAPGSQDNGFIMFQPVVSPDGARVYVPDYRGLLSFRRQASGSLDYVGCLKLARSSCGQRQTWPFTGSHAGIAASPDSRFVYVVGGFTDTYKVKGNAVEAVAVLERTDASPGLRLVQTVKLPLWGVDNREGVPSAVVSPDGRHLYAVVENKLVTFARNRQSGEIRLTRCAGEDEYSYDTKTCDRLDTPAMQELHGLALTRDGRGVAIAGADGISFLKRKPSTGALGAIKRIQGQKTVTPQACASTLRGGPCRTDIPFDFGPGPIAFSKRGDRLFTTTWSQQVLLSMTTPFGGGSRATASSRAVDHRLGINNWMVGTTRSQVKKVYRGTELKPLRFAVGIDLISEHSEPEPTTETVRMTLPKGLTWGSRAASPKTLWPAGVPDYWSFTPQSRSCSVTGQVATCQAVGVPDSTNLFGWILDVEATSAGRYTIHGEVVDPADGRNRAPRGAQTPASADLNLIVGERSGRVAVSKVTLTRLASRPSFVYASVNTQQGGVPVRADSVTCTMDFPTEKSFGGPRVQKVPKQMLPAFTSLGEVKCIHGFNNARYEGKTMTGAMEFTVGKATVTRRYSVRIGPGSSLLSPRGAVVSKG